MKPSAVGSAVSEDNLEIPLIDFSAFLSGDETTKRTTAQAILEGFQRAGFIYLKNHGIPKVKVQEAFSESAKFFKRPEEQKMELGWTTPEANRGYSQPGREKTTDATDPAEIEKIREREGVDLKESFEIGREGEPNCPNQWPSKFDQDGEVFKERMLDFHDRVKQLHVQIMRAIAVGLAIEETWFDGFCDQGDNTLRLLHYPSVRSEVFQKNKDTVRAGAHTDYGSITCLFQSGGDGQCRTFIIRIHSPDEHAIHVWNWRNSASDAKISVDIELTCSWQDLAGGLQVLSPNGNYIDATPIEDSIVVNAGDLLARWSNDSIRSTKHRVVEPPTTADVHPARYSIAYFCNPNFNRFIDCIPGTYSEMQPKKYAGINRYHASRVNLLGTELTESQWGLLGAAVDCNILSETPQAVTAELKEHDSG